MTSSFTENIEYNDEYNTESESEDDFSSNIQNLTKRQQYTL